MDTPVYTLKQESPLTAHEYNKLRDYLQELADGKFGYANYDTSFTMSNLQQFALNGSLVRVYLGEAFVGCVLYDIVLSFFSMRPSVVEVGVWSFGELPGFGRIACDILNAVGVANHCDYICTGNSLGNPLADNLYKKRGYKCFNSYIKEVDYNNE